jgi:hypothetical protein
MPRVEASKSMILCINYAEYQVLLHVEIFADSFDAKWFRW